MTFLLVLGLVLLFGCESSPDYQHDNFSQQDKRQEKGNPYEEGTGHFAGYEWAERTGGNCNSHSQSFNEGCEEYHSQ